METVWTVLWVGLSTWAVVLLLIHKREPSSTLAWLLFVTLVPVLGATLFLIFGPQRLERHAIKRKQEIERALSLTPASVTEAATEGSGEARKTLLQRGGAEKEVFTLASRVSEYRATSENAVELLLDPQGALLAMQKAIGEAKRFIHLEYYIISSDEVTRQLFEHLRRAAERGVEVRILYDALGSLSLKRMYFRPLAKHGVKIAGFLPFSLVPHRINMNFRNHRKILVVDGDTAFTGGTNIGKEYLGRRNKNQWRDYSVRVRGPVCRQLQDVFAKDWQFTTQEDLFQTKYYPPPEAFGDSIIQVLESGPDSAFQTLHQAIFLAINSAQSEILLTTPYFIPDASMMEALTVAALRGIRVRLLLPFKCDNRLVQFASRSFYDELLHAGVEIYEYEPRILHAKLMLIDGKWTMLGSANMDIRSFRLNFELNLLVYGETVAGEAAAMFAADLEESKRVDAAEFAARPLGRQMIENACRLLSPVL